MPGTGLRIQILLACALASATASVASGAALTHRAPALVSQPADSVPVPFDSTSAATDSLASGATAAATEDLGPTTEAPWNPPQAVPSAETWETVLRFPGRVATLPLSLLGQATKNGLIFVEESQTIPKVRAVIELQRKLGLFLTTANLGDRTGFGAALQYVPPPLGGHLYGDISASTAQFNRGRVGVRGGPVGLEYQYEWRSRDLFFGLGDEGGEDSVASYASRIERVQATAGWTWGEAGHPRTEARGWVGPREMVQRNGQDPHREGLVERFPSLADAILDTHVEHLIYGALLAHDHRRGAPHWSHGWRLAAAVERFDKPIEAIALHDANTPALQFTRRSAEAEGGWSFGRDPRTFRLELRAVDHDFSDAPGVLLLGDLARLGGREGLSGFEPGRFHGADLAVGKLSYIFPLARYFECDLHAEAGDVYDRLKDFRLDTLEHSYGVGLRPRLDTSVIGLIGVDWSEEGVRVRYSVGGVE